jgi:hypothetical protein
MLQQRTTLACLLLASAAVLIPRSAHAVHKSWIIRNNGAQCAFDTPNASLDNYYGYALYNSATYSRTVGCPLALSARWGSTTPAISIPRWAGAHAANIYVKNGKPGTAVSCTTRALLASGVIRYSRTASTTAGGDQILTTAYGSFNSAGQDEGGQWGGTLETYETDTVRSMYFECSLPGNQSAVWGYKVRICQDFSPGRTDCGTPDNGEGYTFPGQGGSDIIQTSGIECYSESNEVSRGYSGIVNSNAGYASVYCPLTLPADDTKEAVTTLYYVNVEYKPAVANQYPICQVVWRDRHGQGAGTAVQHWSDTFDHSDFNNYVSIGNLLVRLPVGAAVYCDLPPGMTLQGITSKVGVSPVSGGG